MSWLVENMKWIMVVSGALTCTILYTAVAPEAALRSTFGEAPDGPLAAIIVRSWATLIAIVGGMLVYAAFDPPSRPPVLIISALGKLAFVALVAAHGARYLSRQAGIAVALDATMAVLFLAYLVGARSRL